MCQTVIEYMSPLSTPIGYALPRIVIEMMGRGEFRNPDRYDSATDIMEKLSVTAITVI
jgi:hypothetical protein